MPPQPSLFVNKTRRDFRVPSNTLKRLELNYSTKASIFLLAVLCIILLGGDAIDDLFHHDLALQPPQYSNSCSVRFKSNKMGLCYFIPYQGNFGDELGPAAVDRILEQHFQCTSSIRKLDLHNGAIDAQRHRDGTTCLFSLGSIFHTIKSGDHVWGTGINPYWQNKQSTYPSGLTIYSVRGPKTEALVRQHMGQQQTIPHGDPGFVVPMLYPELTSRKRRSPQGSHRFCFVPHFHDLHRAQQDLPRKVRFVSAHQSWRPVVKTLARQCDFVAASSLHGIIVADALGIPSMWFQWTDTMTAKSEGHFKYLDYLASIERTIRIPESDLSQIVNANAYSPALDIIARQSIFNRTLASFPFHLFEAVPKNGATGIY